MRRHSVSTQIDIPSQARRCRTGEFGAKVTRVWDDLTKAAVDEMMADGHCREKDQDRAVPDDALHRPARGRRSLAPLSGHSADDMRR
jgi:N-methylhydantoinase A